MRARSTWLENKHEIPRQAATRRQADLYKMNQEHPQPSATDYENGDPDSWAETPVSADKMSVNDEYDGEHVKRNEIGMAEFREDTWKHKDAEKWNDGKKYDNAKVATERKAMAATKLAHVLLRTDNEEAVTDTAVDFMALPSKSLFAALKRLVALSPDSLSKQSKLKRATACTKLAASILGDRVSEKHLGQLASAFMSIDDPTLKSILKTVAVARVAQQEQEEEEEQGSNVAQEEQEEEQEQQSQQQQAQQQEQEEEEQCSVAQQQQQAQQEQEEQECDVAQQEQQGQQEQQALNAEELAILDELLHGEMAEQGVAPAVDPMNAAFGGPVVPECGISFGDEDGCAVLNVVSLDELFADDEEVIAQRQIAAAGSEAHGFARAASTKGAKKLGQVKAAPAKSAANSLESLWDRQ